MNTMNLLVEIDMSQNNLVGGQAIQYKRLNDHLSMLRSILPKISKMDRTSILGDMIDYMNELLERIRQLQEEIDQQQEMSAVLSIFRELNPNDMLARNTPKFEVERKEGGDTQVEIYSAARPGLLLSTVSTLEMLGLDIQQCVVSCFNDFGIHASVLTHPTINLPAHTPPSSLRRDVAPRPPHAVDTAAGTSSTVRSRKPDALCLRPTPST